MIKFNIYCLLSIFISFLYLSTCLPSTIVSHIDHYHLRFVKEETPSIDSKNEKEQNEKDIDSPDRSESWTFWFPSNGIQDRERRPTGGCASDR